VAAVAAVAAACLPDGRLWRYQQHVQHMGLVQYVSIMHRVLGSLYHAMAITAPALFVPWTSGSCTHVSLQELQHVSSSGAHTPTPGYGFALF
jgi:hypothetical protein